MGQLCFSYLKHIISRYLRTYSQQILDMIIINHHDKPGETCHCVYSKDVSLRMLIICSVKLTKYTCSELEWHTINYSLYITHASIKICYLVQLMTCLGENENFADACCLFWFLFVDASTVILILFGIKLFILFKNGCT